MSEESIACVSQYPRFTTLPDSLTLLFPLTCRAVEIPK
jgi:hypothetical protein